MTPQPTHSQPTAQPALMPGFIIDGHEDIAWNALEYGRDPIQSALSSRPAEAASGLAELAGERATGLPEWLAGQVGLIFATLFVVPARYDYPPYHSMAYTTLQQAEAHARRQLRYYAELTQRSKAFRLVTNSRVLDEVLSTWMAGSDPSQRVVGLVPLMEGADPVVLPSDLPGWYQNGLRILGLAWVSTQYAGGTHEPGPLTDLGRQLLKSMSELNIVLDLSHSSEEAYLEAVDSYPQQIIASHSNPRQFLPTDRGLSDAMIKKLVARDGVMGIVPYNKFLVPGWVPGSPRPGVAKVIEAIDAVVQLTGSTRFVAIGTDFDGGLGPQALPVGMDTIADVSKIAAGLKTKGYQDADIDNITHNNWLRVLRSALPKP